MAWHREHLRRHAPLTPAVLDPDRAVSTSNRPRTFLHIDMDAFFASVEIRDNPSLRDKAVAVGGGGSGNRGVVTAANYIARKYGLKAGMPAVEAKRRCPNVIFLPIDGRKYVYVSALIMKALEAFSPVVRPLSVDEASLDITGCERLLGSPHQIGKSIKDLIRARFHLPCTVGIGPNRLAAKMATNLGKPDGLLVLESDTVAKTFAPLPVDKMIGIGKSTTAALERLGIKTLGELALFPESLLKIRFGILGPVLKKIAGGEWAGRMKRDDERAPEEKSIGHQRTFGENISDMDKLQAWLVGLAEMVARRVRRAEVVGQVLTLKLRYTNFHTPHHQLRMPVPTDDEGTLIAYAWRLLEEIWIPGAPVRLLGLSLSALAPRVEWSGQLDFFTAKSRQRACDLYLAIDELRDRFGERVIARVMGGRYKDRFKRGSAGAIVPVGKRSCPE